MHADVQHAKGMKVMEIRSRRETLTGMPDWFHGHGFKMGIEFFDPLLVPHLIISASAAKVTIRPATSVYPDYKGHPGNWFVDWEIVQCRPYEEGVRGRAILSAEDLSVAFSAHSSGPYANNQRNLAERFEADFMRQRAFIRRGRFLNIPGPGTGHDGDPNVSILLDEAMLIAVKQLR